jgi:hypothetical protein
VLASIGSNENFPIAAILTKKEFKSITKFHYEKYKKHVSNI